MSDLPERKRNRLKGYNYSQNGLYFLTVCTKDKECILGRIVGDGDLDVPQMILSDYGKIVEKYIQSIERAYSDITLMNYVIMPNHIHMIAMLYSDSNIYQKSTTKSSVNDDIPVMISALKKLVNKEIGYNIWQRSYHDHIIRNDDDLEKYIEYIIRNPLEWECDDNF